MIYILGIAHPMLLNYLVRRNNNERKRDEHFKLRKNNNDRENIIISLVSFHIISIKKCLN